MKKLAFGLLIGIFVVLLGLAGFSPAQAAPLLQSTANPTPTPGADGKILYLVQSGDTLSGISAWAGVSVEELRQLNNMAEEDALIAGVYIQLGVDAGTAATAQANYAAQPTPTAIIDSAAVCVLLYLDVNGDAARQTEEIAMAEGQLSVVEQSGLYAQQATTTYSLDALCLSDLPPGSYQVAMTLPEGYYRTTDLDATIDLAAGDTAYFSFGMSPNPADERPDDPGNTGVDPFLIIGGLLLVLGGGAGLYVAITNRGRASEEE
jgi:LysM repeat protein